MLIPTLPPRQKPHILQARPGLPHVQVKEFLGTTLCAWPEVLNYLGSNSGVFKGAGSHLKKSLTRDLEFLTLQSRLEASRGGTGRGLERGLGGA